MTMSAPDFFNVATAVEGREVSAKAADAVSQLRSMMAEGSKLAPMDLPDGTRSFLSPTNPNGRFLAVKGKVITAPFQSTVLGLQPDMRRDGDVWVEFTQGVCTTHDPIQIMWLEAHSGYPEMHEVYHRHYGDNPAECSVHIGLCREQGPGIDVWADLVTGQHPTSSRPATISQDIDIAAFMRGDFAKGNRSLSSGMGALMAEAAENNDNAAAAREKGLQG